VRVRLAGKPFFRVLKSAPDKEFSIHVEGSLNLHPFQLLDSSRKTVDIGRALVNRAQVFLVAKG
jgi:ABC-type sugar transport system ATPase subunit